MSIYNPLQFNNQSFSSRLLQTLDEQKAAKQESLDKMNETLRAEAAQGRFGSMANDILNQALESASSQGLIGVNQYEIMNKAMPQFYKAKASVNELNNAYNAELEAAKADERINVDANYLKYLNDKYYPEGVNLDDMSSHAANAVNKGFNLSENYQFLNKTVVQKQLMDSIGQIKMDEYVDEGGGEYFLKTTEGKELVTAQGAKVLAQNEAFLGLALDALGVSSLAETSLEEVAGVFNNVIQTGSPKSETMTPIQMRPIAGMQQSTQQSIVQASANEEIRNKRSDEANKFAPLIEAEYQMLLEQDPDATINEAYQNLLNEKDGKGNPKYSARALSNAYAQMNKSKAKPSESDKAEVRNKENAQMILDINMTTKDGIEGIKGMTYGDLFVDSVVEDKDKGTVSVILKTATDDYGTPMVVKIKDGKPDSTDVQRLKNAMISAAYGSEYIEGTGTGGVLQGKGSKYHDN